MRFKTLVFGVLFSFGLLLTIGISYGYERAIEAEAADTIRSTDGLLLMMMQLPGGNLYGWKVQRRLAAVVKVGRI